MNRATPSPGARVRIGRIFLLPRRLLACVTLALHVSLAIPAGAGAEAERADERASPSAEVARRAADAAPRAARPAHPRRAPGDPLRAQRKRVLRRSGLALAAVGLAGLATSAAAWIYARRTHRSAAPHCDGDGDCSTARSADAYTRAYRAAEVARYFSIPSAVLLGSGTTLFVVGSVTWGREPGAYAARRSRPSLADLELRVALRF